MFNGNPEATGKTVEIHCKDGLVLKIEDDLHDYFLCKIYYLKIKRKHGYDSHT